MFKCTKTMIAPEHDQHQKQQQQQKNSRYIETPLSEHSSIAPNVLETPRGIRKTERVPLKNWCSIKKRVLEKLRCSDKRGPTL